MEFVINQNNYKTNDEKKIKFVICKNNIIDIFWYNKYYFQKVVKKTCFFVLIMLK